MRQVVLTSDTEKDGPGHQEGVHVGDSLVKLGAQQELVVQNEGQKIGDGPSPKNLGTLSAVAQEKEKRILLRFNDIEIIPMGADKVFVRSSEGIDSMSIVSKAEEFFKLVFSSWMRWDKVVQPYHRGAFLRTDNCSADRDKLDFARVLLATPKLDLINRVEKVMVDGVLAEIKIVEEWGYAKGEDTCLFEEGIATEASQSDCEEGHIEPDVCRNVDMLVDKITVGLEEAAEEVANGRGDEVSSDKHDGNTSGVGDSKGESEQSVGIPSPVCDNIDVQKVCPHGDAGNGDLKVGGAPLQTDPQACPTTRKTNGESRRDADNQVQNNRANSCPPVATRSVTSGPWSLEWLHDHDHGEVGVTFSARKRGNKGGHQRLRQKKVGISEPKRRKAGGVLRHPLHSLKKVARLPRDDRVEVLKVLNKSMLRRRRRVNRLCSESNQANTEESSSSVSNNNYWKNWVAMQGNDQMVLEDVREFSNSIGVNFKGDNANMFSALSRADKSKKIISWNVRGLGGLEKRKEVRGLLTIWDSSEVEVWSSENRDHVLRCHGRFTKSGEEFVVANVYAPYDDGAKLGLWGSLSARIQSMGRRRLCVCGDFNAVKLIDERRSSRGGPRSLDHIPFNSLIDDNNLIDLPLCSRKFTWFKGDGLSISRPDRFLLSEEWCLTWPNCTQTARLRGLSDHCSLVLSANEDDWGPRPSRMLKCWRDVSCYKGFVKDKWNSFQVDGWGGFVLKEKLRMIKTALKDWHTAHTQNLPSRIDSLKARLSTLDLKGEEEALSEAEIDELHRAVFSHFASHFKAINMERPGVDNLHFKRLNQLECSSLTKPFSEAEVKSAVWDCDSYKSPGPDGVNFGFIKDFWVELRGDVMRFIAEFHRNGKLTKGLNSTFIALIPKIDSPQRLNNFRPISLVGSLYKILAKVLANRLRSVIGSVIYESQTAFVKDRQILDGILIANEVVDEARKSKKELMLFKVDFEKAYDSVDWGYLDDVMGRMSFSVLWRKWIKECGCTATASVLVNGSPTDKFPLERGLRQGDPLSPFHFLLEAEGLNVLMEAAVASNLFTGYSIGERDSVSVSHLQFADDTLLWRRQLWVWEEEMLRECQILLLNITLQVQSSDRWQWQPDPDEGYTVRGAYQLLTSQVSATMDDAETLIWHSQVPLKVSIFAWRLLRDRQSRSITYSSLAVPLDPFGLYRWISGAAFLYAAHLACVCLGRVDKKKSSLISRLDKQFPSVVGQDQAFLF
ncbi:hypothetical protein TSUD_277120 [Trifolium subterraneum]|uniref:Reverse transcriptase domain-containing protein n=1 Tax=Trifolium subterraneum TaxID=3900 RepID=A0A2Z6MXE6_TRISU|nr:hypothetical protein TSUD_277120 [Trifolium subterraneum]